MEFECKRGRYGYIRFLARFVHTGFGVDSNINFYIDTGSPKSIFMYEQAVLWKLPYERLRKTDDPIRIAGIKADAHILEGGDLIIRASTGKLQIIPFSPVLVLGPPARKNGESPQAVPPILGNDFVSRFTFVAESETLGGRAYFTDRRVRVI